MPERKDPWFLRLINEILLLRYRLQVIGARHLPAGCAVIACNHLLHTDFRFHVKAIRHSLRFLGIRDNTPWSSINRAIGLLFRLSCGLIDALLEGYVIFMERGRPLAPSVTARVLRALSVGHYLIVMTEGRVRKAEGEQCSYRGAGYFALKSGCPIMPVGVSMQRRGLLARRVVYRIGTAVPLPEACGTFRARTVAYTRAVDQAVDRLLALNAAGQGSPVARGR